MLWRLRSQRVIIIISIIIANSVQPRTVLAMTMTMMMVTRTTDLWLELFYDLVDLLAAVHFSVHVGQIVLYVYCIIGFLRLLLLILVNFLSISCHRLKNENDYVYAIDLCYVQVWHLL